MLLLTGQKPNPEAKKETPEKLLKIRLYPHIQRFARLINWNITHMTYMDQIFTYESTMMETNVTVNLKGHYISKLKNYISRIFFTQRTPEDLNEMVRARIRRVQNYVLNRVENPANPMTEREREFAFDLINRLDIFHLQVSVPYDLKADPLRVLILLLT
jgi:hypothetical protein